MTEEQAARIGMSVAARELIVSENTVRRLCDMGVVKAVRDSAGRRQLTKVQVKALRAYLDQKRAA